MEKNNYYYKEQECNDVFNRLGQVYNTCTPENHPVIFRTEEDFKAGMSILAICAKLYPQIRIFAFQLMSNHMHMVVSGDKAVIEDFFYYFKDRLDWYFEGNVDLKDFNLKFNSIDDLAYFRIAIVYTNRNGFVVLDNVTPFSYPWGTSQYFFQPLASNYAKVTAKPITVIPLRRLMHTKNVDKMKDIKVVDGCVCPLEFCDVATAESMFRDAKQYYYMISRKVEAYASVAKSLGESIFFSDNDLYIAAKTLAQNHFGANDLAVLTAYQKVELAKRLHYDYNASDKQLQRMLKIDPEILKAMF